MAAVLINFLAWLSILTPRLRRLAHRCRFLFLWGKYSKFPSGLFVYLFAHG